MLRDLLDIPNNSVPSGLYCLSDSIWLGEKLADMFMTELIIDPIAVIRVYHNDGRVNNGQFHNDRTSNGPWMDVYVAYINISFLPLCSHLYRNRLSKNHLPSGQWTIYILISRDKDIPKTMQSHSDSDSDL